MAEREESRLKKCDEGPGRKCCEAPKAEPKDHKGHGSLFNTLNSMPLNSFTCRNVGGRLNANVQCTIVRRDRHGEASRPGGDSKRSVAEGSGSKRSDTTR